MQQYIKSNKGFSLVEVMITLMLGLIVLLMVVQVFVNTKESHAQNDRVSETLESGRFAMRQIATDLKNAGFFGGVIDPSLISVDASLTSPSIDCGTSSETNWAYDLTTYRSLQYDANPGNTNNHTCIASSDLYTGSDILAVKRVFAQPYDPTAIPLPLKKYNIYLRSDFNSACLWYYDGSASAPSGGNCPATGVQDWLYLTHVYYIRKTNDNGDLVPTLCRKTLDISGGKPTMDNLCLAQGIEKFHIMFGIDTDIPRDGVANKFISNPSTAELTTRAVSARIYVLVRALQQDSTFKNDKTYTLGDMTPYTPNDNYYRRLYSTTVMLRNPMYASVFNDF